MKILNKTALSKLFWLIGLIVLQGCQTSQPIMSGLLATPGCIIAAEDNSFKIVSGKPFTTPFHINHFIAEPVMGGKHLSPEEITTQYDFALEIGAKRVVVTVPGHAKPLFGVLAFLDAGRARGSYFAMDGPGFRSYQIQIPQQYIDAASGGRVSAVYEMIPYKAATGEDFSDLSWVLWLSDQKF